MSNFTILVILNISVIQGFQITFLFNYSLQMTLTHVYSYEINKVLSNITRLLIENQGNTLHCILHTHCAMFILI